MNVYAKLVTSPSSTANRARQETHHQRNSAADAPTGNPARREEASHGRKCRYFHSSHNRLLRLMFGITTATAPYRSIREAHTGRRAYDHYIDVQGGLFVESEQYAQHAVQSIIWNFFGEWAVYIIRGQRTDVHLVVRLLETCPNRGRYCHLIYRIRQRR